MLVYANKSTNIEIILCVMYIVVRFTLRTYSAETFALVSLQVCNMIKLYGGGQRNRSNFLIGMPTFKRSNFFFCREIVVLIVVNIFHSAAHDVRVQYLYYIIFIA